MCQQSVKRKVLVTHSPGLHARPSLAIVKTARAFRAKVKIRHKKQEAAAGDVLQVMSLGVPYGAEVTLLAEGPDAEQALDALAALFADNFGMDDNGRLP